MRQLWVFIIGLLWVTPVWATGPSFTNNCATVSWTANTDADLSGYKLYDRPTLSGTPAIIGTFGSAVTSIFCSQVNFLGGQHYISLSAFDTSSNESAWSAEVPFMISQGGLFLQTLATDTFTRANGGLGANYTDSYTSNTSGQIVSNKALPTVVNTATVERYSAVAPLGDQWGEVTIGTIGGAQAVNIGVELALPATSTHNGYRCFAAINQTNKSGIRRFDANVSTALASETLTTWAAGDKLRCERQGSSIFLYRTVGVTDTLLLTATDTTYPTGQVGLFLFVATSGAVTDAQASALRLGGYTTTPPPDTTPPAQVTGLTAVDTSSGTSYSILITSSAAADNVAVTTYLTERCTGAGCVNFATVHNGLTLSFTDPNLTANTTYCYRRRAQDLAGNLGLYSTTVCATTAAAPVVLPTITTATVTALGATVTWTGPPDTIHVLTDNTSVILPLASFPSGVYSHQWEVGLTFVCFFARNASGVENTNGAEYVCNNLVGVVQTDLTPPVISGMAPTGTLASGTTSATLSWQTNELATCHLGLSDVAYANMTFTASTANQLNFTYNATGLSDGTSTTYFIRCQDQAPSPNINTVSTPITVIVNAVGDTIPPVLSGGSPSGALAAGTTSVSMELNSSENATCKYGTVAGTAYASIASTFNTTGTTAHSQTIGGLTNGSSSTYYIRCIDGAANANLTDYVISWSVILPDTTAPILSGGTPSGSFASGTTSVSMGVQTNELSTCKYSSTAGETYAAMAGTFSTTGGTAHSQTISGLSDGNTYTRYVKCIDGASNADLSDYVITWSVTTVPIPPDITPPVRSNGAPTGILNAGITSTTMSLTTNEAATCRYSSTAGTTFGAMTNAFSTTGGTSHSTFVFGLADGATVTRYIKCVDTAFNANLDDYIIQWSVAVGQAAPPILTAGAPSGELVAGTTSTPMTLTTNVNATCKYSQSAGQLYAAMANTFTTTGGTSHSQTITGLTNNLSVTYYVKCAEASGSANATDYVITWSVAAAAPDTTAPAVPTNLVCAALGSTQLSCTFTAGTDNVLVTGYDVYVCAGLNCSVFTIVATWGTGTTQTLNGLIQSTPYTVKLKTFDAAGNRSAAFSTASTTSTTATPDVIPPSDMSSLFPNTSLVLYNSVTIFWNPGTDNQAIVNTVIERCVVGQGCPNFQVLSTTTGNSLTDTTVQPLMHYQYRGKFLDKAGNASVNYSPILPVTTPALPPGITQGTCPCKNRN